LRDSAETPDVEGEVWLAAEGAADAALSSGDEDEAGEEENDEHAASIGNSAIVAANAPKRPAPVGQATRLSTPARGHHPIMPHLYQLLAVNHKAERDGIGAFSRGPIGCMEKIQFLPIFNG
jgi:hypothetical protein